MFSEKQVFSQSGQVARKNKTTYTGQKSRANSKYRGSRRRARKRDNRLHNSNKSMLDLGEVEVKISQFTISLLYPPKILPLYHGENLQIQEGYNLELTCRAKGRPTPEITWFRNNDKMFHMWNSYSRRGIVRDSKRSSKLRLSDLKIDDSANYTCNAKNVNGYIKKSVVVTVKPRTTPAPVTETNISDRCQKYCVNGICFLSPEGDPACSCFPNYFGSRCDTHIPPPPRSSIGRSSEPTKDTDCQKSCDPVFGRILLFSSIGILIFVLILFLLLFLWQNRQRRKSFIKWDRERRLVANKYEGVQVNLQPTAGASGTESNMSTIAGPDNNTLSRIPQDNANFLLWATDSGHMNRNLVPAIPPGSSTPQFGFIAGGGGSRPGSPRPIYPPHTNPNPAINRSLSNTPSSIRHSTQDEETSGPGQLCNYCSGNFESNCSAALLSSGHRVTNSASNSAMANVLNSQQRHTHHFQSRTGRSSRRQSPVTLDMAPGSNTRVFRYENVASGEGQNRTESSSPPCHCSTINSSGSVSNMHTFTSMPECDV